VQIQRLLDEGLFVATYKFALLQSLADIAIEQGDDSEASLAVSTDAIAEKFIRYYWRQAMPYPAAVDTRVLQQNAGRQAAVLNVVRRARATLGDSLVAAMNNGPAWNRLVREVAEVVRIMPLWKLQTAGAPGLPVRQHGRRQHRHPSSRRRILLPQVPPVDLRSRSQSSSGTTGGRRCHILQRWTRECFSRTRDDRPPS
jgi:hypothetical protein